LIPSIAAYYTTNAYIDHISQYHIHLPHTTKLTDRPLPVEVTCAVDEGVPSDVETVSPASDPVDDDVEVVFSLLSLTGPHRSSGVMSSDTSSPETFLADLNSSIGLMASD